MSKLRDQIDNFVARIKLVLGLRDDADLTRRAYLLKWVSQTLDALRDSQDQTQKKSLTGKILNKWFSKTKEVSPETVSRKEFQKQLGVLESHLNSKVIPDDFSLSTGYDVPSKVKEDILCLKKGMIDFTMWRATGPFLGSCYFPQAMAQKLLNLNQQTQNIKFQRIGPNMVHQCQRLLVRELLGRVFRDSGNLAFVIRIAPVQQNASPTYFLVQDLSPLKQFNFSFGDVRYQREDQVLCDKDDTEASVSQQNITEILLSELMTLELQTFVSQFGCVKEVKEGKKQLRIVKYFEYSADNRIEYAGLRSKLFFFNDYFRELELPLEIIKGCIYKKDTFLKFFSAIQLLIDLQSQDFEVPDPQDKGKVRSLLMHEDSILIVTRMLHKILVVRHWLDQVVRPIRKTITLASIIDQILPIVNFINGGSIQNPTEYEKNVKRMDIGQFINERVDSKFSIQFLGTCRQLSVASMRQALVGSGKAQWINSAFKELLNMVDLENYKPEEAAYIIQIFIHNAPLLNQDTLGAQWKSVKVWKSIFKAIETGGTDFSMLDIGVQMAPYYVGLDPVAFGAEDYFDLVRNTVETEKKVASVISFGRYMQSEFRDLFNERFELLLNKCFKYKKLRIASAIMQNFNIKKIQFKDLIGTTQGFPVTQQAMSYLVKSLQERHPSKYRKFKWDEIFMVHFQKTDPKTNYVPIETLDYGQCWLPQEVLNNIVREKQQLLGLRTTLISQDDYMFTLKHDVTKITYGNVQVYVEQSSTPGFDFFFSKLIETLDASFIKPHTTYFTLHNTVFQFTECLPMGFTFPEVSKTLKQDFINKCVNKDTLSQAIILSLLINPSSISFDDIVLRPNGPSKYHLYIRNFKNYNAYAYTTVPNPKLKTRNALLLLDVMNQSISPENMQKYANMDVQGKIRSLFRKLRQFCDRMQVMQSKLGTTPGVFKYEMPVLAIPFEKDFLIRFSERFQRVSNIFKRRIKNNITVTHFGLLEKLSPVVGIFYRCLNEMQIPLMEKWNSVQKYTTFRTNFVDSSLFKFFSSFSQYQIQEEYYYPDNLEKLQFVGVSQCLLKLKEEQTNNLIFRIQSQEEIVNLLLSEEGNNVEYYMRNIDMRSYTDKTQSLILDIYKKLSIRYITDEKYKALESLYLIGFGLAQESILLGFGFQRISYMVLEGCPKIGDSQLKIVSGKMPCLTYLRLQKLFSLTCIASSKNLTHGLSEALKFPVLTTLVINMCENLEYIDISCGALANIQLKRNTKLEAVFINSRSLSNIASISNPQLKLQNIGFYIFTGVDVYIDGKSCHGDTKKIQGGCDYTAMVHKLLFGILEHFEDLKTKAVLCVTMFKTNNLTPNFKNTVASLMSSLVNRYVSGNFNLSVQGESQLFNEMIKVFIKNVKLQELTFCAEYLQKETPLNGKILQSFLDNLKLIQTEKGPKYLKSLTFRRVPEKALKLLFSLVNVFRADEVMMITIENIDDNLKEYYNILLAISQNQNIPKIKLTIKNSYLDSDIFQEISKRCGSKLSSLELIKCERVISGPMEGFHLEKCKTLVIKQCQFNSFAFLALFKDLHSLEISQNTINEFGFDSLLYDINQLQSLRKLKVSDIFNSAHQVQEFLKRITHSKISVLDLSGNAFTANDLSLIDNLLVSKSIQEFRLTDWTLKDNYNFTAFLNRSSIKKLVISLEQLAHVNEFMVSLSQNKQIISAEVLTDKEQIDLQCFQFAEIRNLQELKLNIRLPLWLVDMLNENSGRKAMESSSTYPIEESFFGKKRRIFDIVSGNDAYKIGLSLDGGGMRGLLLASQLDYLTKEVKKPLHKIFDWIGGTSIGGILALAATGSLDGSNPICDTEEMKQLFTKYGNKIFQKTKYQIFKNLTKARYQGAGIQGVLNEYFKSCRLSNVLKDTNCLVTSVQRVGNLVKIFNSKDAKLDSNEDFFMRDVGRATSAAPIYFPSAQIKNCLLNKEFSLVDGGVGQNNPAKIVIEELKKRAISAGVENKYFLLTLGTGKIAGGTSIPTSAGYSSLQPIIDSFVESNSYFVEKDLETYHRGKYCRVAPILNLTASDLKLDNTSENVLQQYQKIGEMTAMNAFDKDCRYGTYNDRSLVEWLAQNTARKDE